MCAPVFPGYCHFFCKFTFICFAMGVSVIFLLFSKNVLYNIDTDIFVTF